MTEREENCKVLAEWLEQKPEELRHYQGPRDFSGRIKLQISPLGAWLPCWRESGPSEVVPCTEWKPRDFYTDETANAMLRRKLAKEFRSVVLQYRTHLGWNCEAWTNATAEVRDCWIGTDYQKDKSELDVVCMLSLKAAALLIARPA